jgi:hypothetical protein
MSFRDGSDCKYVALMWALSVNPDWFLSIFCNGTLFEK